MADSLKRKLPDICLMGICSHSECYMQRESQRGSARGIMQSDFDAFGNLKLSQPRKDRDS